jgi:hypothetical protein
MGHPLPFMKLIVEKDVGSSTISNYNPINAKFFPNYLGYHWDSECLLYSKFSLSTMRTLYQSECCFYMIKPFKGFFQWKKTMCGFHQMKSVWMEVCVASNLISNHPMQNSSSEEELWSLSLKQNQFGWWAKMRKVGSGVVSLVMSICKCPDLVSNQKGWPKVTWYWLWVGHLSCNDLHFLAMGFWGASMFSTWQSLIWCLYHCCQIGGLEESPPKESLVFVCANF